jgi:hypothetical protein
MINGAFPKNNLPNASRKGHLSTHDALLSTPNPFFHGEGCPANTHSVPGNLVCAYMGVLVGLGPRMLPVNVEPVDGTPN